MKAKIYILFLFLSFQAQAQLFVDNSYTVEEMVMDFFDNSCVTPSNISTTGTTDALAFFDAGNTNLGVQAGIFISSGNVFSAVGPNTQGGTSENLGLAGDADLDALSTASTFDAVTIEMDIAATESELVFSYVFGSEEYPEFVGSAFNDIFAFFISGPGIDGWQNIALIPGTTDPVAINSVNGNMNSDYFVDNTGGQDVEFDAYTTELTAQIAVVPGETYGVKIVVADAGDSVFNSGIFLGVASLCGEENLQPQNVTDISVDGNTVTFDNQTKYVSSHLWDFGDGTTSTDRIPEPHTYAEDGTYEVTLTTSNYCCTETSVTTVQIGETSSLDEIENRPFTLTPNPAVDFAQISFETNMNFQARLVDAQGRLLSTQEASGQASFDLRNLSTGIYFLEVETETGSYTEKILKTK